MCDSKQAALLGGWVLREAGLDLQAQSQKRVPPERRLLAEGIRRDYKQPDKFLSTGVRQDSGSNTRKVLREME